MDKTVSLIMAGGRGKRMNVLCHERPKPVMPFAGKFKVIDFTLSNCVYSEINDIAVLTDYQRSSMANYLSRWNMANKLKSLDILEPKKGSYKGTADAVYQNLTYLQKHSARNALILAGDHIYKMEYRKLIAFHEQTNAAVTVAVIRVPIEEAHRFGTVTINDNGEIVEFVEKSRYPRSNLASMGIYVFNVDVLARRLMEDAGRSDSSHDFGYSILPDMIGKDKVCAYEFNGYWKDIGTPQAYYDANMELIRKQPSFSLNTTRTVLTRHLELPAPRISQQGVVVNSLLSPGCIIKGYVENSILSPGVFVDEKAEIRDSVLMPDVSIGYHSVVDACVLDEEVNIGKLCYIGFGKSLVSGNCDITVLGKGVTVPSHTAIGRDCLILPHTKSSGFRDNFIASGSILSPQGISQKS